MANLGGPKGPGDPGKGARILQLRPSGSPESPNKVAPKSGQKANPQERLESAVRPGPAAPAGSPSAPPAADANPSGAATFDREAAPPREGFVPAEASQARGAGVRARLTALGVRGADTLPIKTATSDAVRILTTPLGQILEGSATIESPRGLARLDGVVRVTGDLTIRESAIKSPDLLALGSLVEIGGRLTLEGNAALQALDALQALERARGLYVGYNRSLQKIVLPKLRQVDAALIVEGNPALTQVQLPALARGGLYLHFHDNVALTTVTLPMLGSLERELSLVDNPRLAQVKIGSRERPVDLERVELRTNGAAAFPQLFAKPRT